MFEIIGIIVVVWFGFLIVKSIALGGIKGTLLRASHTAMEQGIPSEFVRTAIINSDKLIMVRKELEKSVRNFASMELYQQYAAAIVVSYQSLSDIERHRIPRSSKTDYTKPRNHSDIEHLISNAVKIYPVELKCPRFTYEALSEFLEAYEAGTEYFPNYSGARTWVTIGQHEYALDVTVINPDAQDESGIVLSARLS